MVPPECELRLSSSTSSEQGSSVVTGGSRRDRRDDRRRVSSLGRCPCLHLISARPDALRRRSPAELTAPGDDGAGSCHAAPAESVDGSPASSSWVGAVAAARAAEFDVARQQRPGGPPWGAPLEEYPDQAFDRRVRPQNVKSVFHATVQVPCRLLRAAGRPPPRSGNASSIIGLDRGHHRPPEWGETTPIRRPRRRCNNLNSSGSLTGWPSSRRSITVNRGSLPGPFPPSKIDRVPSPAGPRGERPRVAKSFVPMRRWGEPRGTSRLACIYLASGGRSLREPAWVLPVDGGISPATVDRRPLRRKRRDDLARAKVSITRLTCFHGGGPVGEPESGG